MMTIKDYAQDVELEIEEIEALCDKIGIEYQDENTDLDETSIILLDNAVAEKDNEEEIIEDEEVEERRLEEEVEDKAEELAFNTKIDLDDTTSFTKVKPKQVKKNDNNKKDFLKEYRKEIEKITDSVVVENDYFRVKSDKIFILDSLLVDLLHFKD